MNDLLATVLAHPLTRAVGAALLHSLWQIALIGAVLGVALRMSRQSSAQWRYALATAALLCAVTAMVATVLLYVASATGAPLAGAGAVAVSDGAQRVREALVPEFLVSLVGFQAWLSIIWALTAGLLLTRLGLEFLAVHRLVRVGVTPGPLPLLNSARVLALRLEITRMVRVLESRIAPVPMVIGWLRPVVLLPAAMIAGLGHSQLEMLLAHELAHVRRFDFFVNALQRMIEALLFYHPVVRWISRQISQERENCCDDMAVQVCSDRIGYARALAAAAEFRLQAAPAFALGAISAAMPMKARIVRLLPHSGRTPGRQPVGKLFGVLVLLLASALASLGVPPKPLGGSVASQLLRLPLVAQREGNESAWDYQVVQSDAMPPVDDLDPGLGRKPLPARSVAFVTQEEPSLAADQSFSKQETVEQQVSANLDLLARRAGGEVRPSVSSLQSEEAEPVPASADASAEPKAVAPTILAATALPASTALAPTDSPARVRYAPQPVYPSIARRRLIEGDVAVEFQVSPSGRVLDVRIIGRARSYLARAVTNALAQWRFVPALKNGEAVSSRQKREFSFHLAGLGNFDRPATTGTHIH